MAFHFDWHEAKQQINLQKHGVSFTTAQEAFYDPTRVIAQDDAHSTAKERRYYCFGKAGGGVLTVRFTVRGSTIWIIGAGYWRKGRKIYDTQKS